MIGWLVWEARAWPLTPQLFPLTIGIPAVALAIVQMRFATRRLLAWTARQRVGDYQLVTRAPPPGDVGALSAALARRRSVEMALWIVAFTVGVLVLGFRIAAFVLPLAFFMLASRERGRVALPIAFGGVINQAHAV